MTFDYCCSQDGHGLEIPVFPRYSYRLSASSRKDSFFFRKNMTNIFRAMKIMFSIKRSSSMKRKPMHWPSRSCRWAGASRNRYLSCAMKASLLTRKMSGGFRCADLTSRCRLSLKKMKLSPVCSNVMSMWRCHCSSAIPFPSLTVFFSTDIREHCPHLSALII